MPLGSVFTRLIKAIAGNSTTSIKITPTPGKRLHGINLSVYYPNGTNSLVGLATALTEIRVLIGTAVKWRLNGTQLRDFVLLYGTTRDWNGAPNTYAELRLPFAPEWLFAGVANLMAINPAMAGGNVTVEIDSANALTVKAYERISNDLDAPSPGYLSLQVISPVLGSTSMYVEEPVKPVGKLLLASIYPDSTAVATTTAGLYIGRDNEPAYEEVDSDVNLDILETAGFSPAASGRTANIFDIAGARGDALNEAFDLGDAGVARFKLTSAGYGGAAKILLARLVPYGAAFSV